MIGTTRRGFLKSTAGVLALSLSRLGWQGNSSAHALGTDTVPTIAYEGFEDIYREKWKWDRVAKGTHFVNCWYQRGCNWNVYVRNGIVWREEQAGMYEQIDPRIPDYNPRGCQKGACYSERMYDASRLRHPLKRVGERGAGKWMRISWEQALREVADKTIDAMISEDGPGSITWDHGTAGTSGGSGLAMTRASLVLDTPVLDLTTEVGDHRPGVCVTTGKVSFCSSSDDLFYSDLIFIWGGNPVYTQVPNAHFIMEARYNGARIITIAPDYSASAIHADQWVPVNVATDAALGLGMAHVMIAEGIYDRRFVQEQTDLPLLVHKRNGRFLRGSDISPDGSDESFFFYDLARQQLAEASGRTLKLDGLDPALEGEFEIETANGLIVVTPVFSRLRQHLQQYSPEAASLICGTDPGVIRDLARRLASARAATCIAQSNFSKFYHGIEMERAQILCFALAGQMGRKGAGYMGFAFLNVDSVEGLSQLSGKEAPSIALAALGLKMMPSIVADKAKGYTAEMSMYEMAREAYRAGATPASVLWLYHNGGLGTLYGRSADWDRYMKRPLHEFMEEAVDRGWQLKPKIRQRIFFECGGNVLRRFRAYDVMIDKLLPQLDMIVTLDWRMSNTALYSDYVFPAAAWYEKDDITWATPLSPFSQVITRAVAPAGEARSDWEFYCLLLKEIQKRARERGIDGFRDRHGEHRDFDVYDQFTFGGRYTEDNVEDFLDLILGLATNVGGVNWEKLKEKGFQRFTSLGESGYLNIGNATDVREHETITACTWHTEKKEPWPTLTRRLQFNIDHPLYEELGEVLPVYKENPRIGGEHPLVLTGGHARWSIHASWRDQKYMLQLDRGEPIICVSVQDAVSRGVEDGDAVRVFNDINSIVMQAKLLPALRPGQVTIYHAWEPFQFEGRKGNSTLTPNPINPIQLAGGYFHLQPRIAACTPGATDRATHVDFEKVRRAPAALRNQPYSRRTSSRERPADHP